MTMNGLKLRKVDGGNLEENGKNETGKVGIGSAGKNGHGKGELENGRKAGVGDKNAANVKGGEKKEENGRCAADKEGERGGEGSGGGGCKEWKIGLVNYEGKYLTAETFGFKLNASGTTLKKKQKWTLEFDPREEDTVYLRSHLGRYLAGDRRGNAACSSEERGQAERFRIHYATDGSGRWAISNRNTGYYFGGYDDRVRCYEKKPRKTEWWTVHLDIHPQVTLRNANRQRYASVTGENVCVTQVVPWGPNALITLEYVDGGCLVRAFDGRCLDRHGALVDDVTEDAVFRIEIRRSGLALRDCCGTYLSVVGRDGVVRGRNTTPGKDEFFVVEDSQPQVFITAHNGRMVSTGQGIDVTANQFDVEPTDRETFQLEFESDSSRCRIRSWDNKYWVIEPSVGIRSTGSDPSDAGLFTVDWHLNGVISLAASNGRYVTTRLNGSLHAGSDRVADKELFRVTLINRPQLVLKCEHGFVGCHSSNWSRYECHRATYDEIHVECDLEEPGVYFLKGHNGKYLSVDSDGYLKADQAEDPLPFLLELRGRSKLAIRTSNGQYIVGEQNGTMTAKQSDPHKATLWEF